MSLIGFWSYVHRDDDLTFQRVTQLGRDVVDHYASITAEDIELFLDRDDLHWGDKWRGKVDEALSNVAFFVPVITPRYFKSSECRREFQTFLNRAKGLGLTELILPILYIHVPELAEDEPSDDLMKVVKDIQWEDWTKLRFADRASGEYQQAAHDLAQELHRRMGVLERVDVVAAIESARSSGEGEPEGVIDRLAALEEAMPRWSETLSALTEEIQRIGRIMTQGTEDMEAGEKSGKGFAARLTVARRLATELGEPVDRIAEAGQRFATDLSEIDGGVRTMVEEVVAGNFDVTDDEAVSVDGFFASVRGLALAAQSGLGSVQYMVDSARPLERLSKDMRAPLRKLRTALTSLVQAQQTTDAWIALLDEHDLGLSVEGQALADQWADAATAGTESDEVVP